MRYREDPAESRTSAELEYEVLLFLHKSGIPSPEPVYFDPNSPILESPILVTNKIVGVQILAHPPNPRWAEKAPVFAAQLAQIHQLACPQDLIGKLPEATAEATWFLDGGAIPDYMQAYPDGELIWRTIHDQRASIRTSSPVLVHGDYWSGNILWDQGMLTGVLDWEKAAYGHAGFDVAYCRMEMFIDAMDEAADLFLETYEAIMGNRVENLGFCELAVAALPMVQRAPYLVESPIKERFRQFVANAVRRMPR